MRICKYKYAPVKEPEQRNGLINASDMVILSCPVIAVESIMSKRTMQQLTEHFKEVYTSGITNLNSRLFVIFFSISATQPRCN